MAAAERISEVAQLVAEDPAEQRLVVVSAMGSHPSSPVKVTDLLLNMIDKASKQDQAFLIDLAALQVIICHCMTTSSCLFLALAHGVSSAHLLYSAWAEDDGILLLQEKHVDTAKLLLGEGKELNGFVSRLLDDIANLKAMLHAISIGEITFKEHSIYVCEKSRSQCTPFVIGAYAVSFSGDAQE